jgi:hypothetical protein
MRKVLVPLAAFTLLVGLSACSSSSKSSDASTTTQAATPATGKTAANGPVCQAVIDFQNDVGGVGATTAKNAAVAAKLRTTATKIQNSAPAAISAAAKVYATAMLTAADSVAKANSQGKATKALIPLIYNRDHDHNIAAFAAWLDANC